MTSISKKISIKIILVLGILLVVSGCASSTSSQEAHPDPSSSTFHESTNLDKINERIHLPLEQYAPDHAEREEHNRINVEKVNKCLQEHHLPTVPVPEPHHEPVDRPYGIWSMSNAEKYGYALPTPKESPEKINNLPEELSGNKDASECISKSYSGPNYVGARSNDADVGLRTVASAMTLEDESAQEPIRLWKQCVRDGGGSFTDSQSFWTPDIPDSGPSSKEAVQLAKLDVSCKEKVHLVEKVARVEHKYQMEQINKNKEYLEIQKSHNEEVKKADEAWSKQNIR